jgi:hypothetical protein
MLKDRLGFGFFRCALLAWAPVLAVTAQTLVDLRTQSKSVDFSGASTTKPMKAGTVLPAACGLGEAFFQTNAPAGMNFYLCTAQNAWTLQSGSEGPAGPAGPAGASGAIGIIQSAGANLPVESTLNFTGGGCTDDPTNSRTDCTGAGIAGLAIDVNGSAQGTQPTLNLISGTGIIQACANNSGSNRVDCTPTLDTGYAPSRAMDQAGTDHSIIGTSGGAGSAFLGTGSPTLAAYTQNQTFSFIPSDSGCVVGATLNIDGLGPIPLRKVVGGAVTAVGAGDCPQNVPTLLRAYGSPVSAFLLTPVGAPATDWVSNIAGQSSSQSSVALGTPGAGHYLLNYYADQNSICSTGSNSVSFTFSWTDGSSTRTVTTGSLALSSAQSNASGFLSGLMPIYIGSGAVTYTSTISGSCGTGASSYDLHVALTRLQ